MKKYLISILFTCVCTLIQAQESRFYKEIQAFKKQDSLQMPAKNAILFIGSSSFTRWKDVQAYFPGKPILNRGFGGSSLPDLINYVNDIVFPYEPKQVVIYCGENDFTATGGIEPKVVVDRVKELVALIRTRYPDIPISYVAIKPSPSRAQYQEKVKEANAAIKKWMKKKKRNLQFIDIYDAMLNEDGSFKEEIFVEDRLHMNSKGYAIWQKIIGPYLIN